MVVVNGTPVRVVAGATVELLRDEGGVTSEPFIADLPAGVLRIAGGTEEERLTNAVNAGRTLVQSGATVSIMDRNIERIRISRRVSFGPPPGLSRSLSRRLRGE